MSYHCNRRRFAHQSEATAYASLMQRLTGIVHGVTFEPGEAGGDVPKTAEDHLIAILTAWHAPHHGDLTALIDGLSDPCAAAEAFLKRKADPPRRAPRFEIIDGFGNKDYLARDSRGRWQLSSSSGMPLALCNIVANEPLARFALEDAGDDPAALLAAIKQHLKYAYPVRDLSA